MHRKASILKNINYKIMIKKISFAILLVLTLQSCTSVKEYEKEKLNDPEMKLSAKTAERYETTFQVYREGSAGANGGKSGGGCGCN
jgi:Domain of unknown function (DUF4266)